MVEISSTPESASAAGKRAHPALYFPALSGQVTCMHAFWLLGHSSWAIADIPSAPEADPAAGKRTRSALIGPLPLLPILSVDAWAQQHNQNPCMSASLCVAYYR